MKYLPSISVVFFSLLIGSVLTSLDMQYGIYLMSVGLVLIGLLVGKVNYRNQDYVGVFFTTKKSLVNKLNDNEKLFGLGVLVLMASPFIYMLSMAYLA